MFNKTWKWAGQFRIRQTNIGIESHQIRDQLAVLCADAKYWLENSTYSLPECAVRVHHKLAQIHPFVNGNGRHARLVADLMMFYNKQPQFSWGGKSLLDSEDLIRQTYLEALKKADAGKFDRLIQFALGKVSN
jgi:Fic-DOC domain mobile mystery protein B